MSWINNCHAECPYRKDDHSCSKGNKPATCEDAILINPDGVKLKSFTKYKLILMGPSCHCGQWKNKGNALCRICYNILPVYMRQNLYNHLTGGFGEAYEQAIDYLDRKRNKQTADKQKQTSLIKDPWRK